MKNLTKIKKYIFSSLACLIFPFNAYATFSIAAIDPLTGEVGSAGATCLNNYNLAPAISYIVPGHGVANYQAYINPSVFPLTSNLILAGNTAKQVMQAVNIADNQSQLRQRIIITMHDSKIEKSVFTGSTPLSYGGHASEISGYNYVIAGNMLIGRHVLEDMEMAFNSADGDLTHKLMMSVKSAVKTIGADQRCQRFGVSSASAYLRVAQENDPLNQPSFSINYNSITAGVDPITRIETLYYNARPDSDNDSVPDIIDAFPYDSTETADWNMDGIGNNKDLTAKDYNCGSCGTY